MKLAIAQMVFGALILGNYVVSVCRLPWELPFGDRLILFPAQWTIFLVLGLAVLGCGIAQYLKARG